MILPINENFILSKDDQGITSFNIAATKSSTEILRLLLHPLPNKNESLLRKILPLSIRDMCRNTPLMLACGNNYASEDIRCLSKKKSVYVISRNRYRMSLLHIAIFVNNINRVIILLKECKISTEICDNDYRKLLHYASQNESFKIVEILLSNDARYNACDKYRATPLHYTAELSWPVVYALVSKNSYNYCGMTDKER
uniref:Inversin (inferred by orthology to a human protein) n=1 Tax=Strongyloides venezuelensis TaxID=75913 RepID=A0A0K0FYT0_STRVS